MENHAKKAEDEHVMAIDAHTELLGESCSYSWIVPAHLLGFENGDTAATREPTEATWSAERHRNDLPLTSDSRRKHIEGFLP